MEGKTPDWKDKHYAFYQNKQCEYFPCHKGIDENTFNCLFCYCPLYMLGKDCGGNFQYTEQGVKDCTGCTFPHIQYHYGKVIEKYPLIQEKIKEERYVYKNQRSLRYGITTGTCSTAAAVAAVTRLLLGIHKEKISVITPKNTKLEVNVHEIAVQKHMCEYMVIKDSGDDPDITNQTPIHVRVEIIRDMAALNMSKTFQSPEDETVYLTGGIGVGIITKEGLEQKVGMPAINLVPRNMIFQGLHEIIRETEWKEPLLITVSVPDGELLAKKTFNERLGIEGGISILGTSGMIEPMSEKAIIDTIELEIKQLAHTGCKKLLVTPGNYGQAYASDYLQLDLDHSIKSGNYIGETVDLAISYGMESFLLVGNIGKLIKLAAGIMNTHSKVADGRGEIMAIHTVLCGGTKEMAEEIMKCMNTDRMLSHLKEWGLIEDVLCEICEKINEYMAYRVHGKMKYGVVLFSEKYGYLGETASAGELIEEMKKSR